MLDQKAAWVPRASESRRDISAEVLDRPLSTRLSSYLESFSMPGFVLSTWSGSPATKKLPLCQQLVAYLLGITLVEFFAAKSSWSNETKGRLGAR